MSSDLITQLKVPHLTPIERANVSFNPKEELPARDPRYVDFGEERCSSDLLDSMERIIRRSPEPKSLLLSGHRGCGKTTELLRLKDRFVTGQSRYLTIYCESDGHTDLNDVSFTDVLLAVVHQLWVEARAAGVALNPGRLKTLVDEIKSRLPEGLIPDSIEFEVEIAKLTYEIKKNASNRSLIREHLRPRATSFTEAVNEVIVKAKDLLKEHGYDNLVVIVDNLDRIPRNAQSDNQTPVQEELFVNAGKYLGDLACHAIYTIPPELLYSVKGGRLKDIYGGNPQRLPMVPVTNRQNDPYAEGLGKLRESIEKRLLFVGLTLQEVFDAETTVDRLCRISGGYVRGLLSLVHASLNYVSALPITAAAVEQAIRDERDSYDIAGLPWDVLRTVAANKEQSAAEGFLELLPGHHLLEYRDKDGFWYDINPVLRETRKFKGL